jgi:hypothetical protein
VSRFPIVFFVRRAILRSVRLKMCNVLSFLAYICKSGPFFEGFWICRLDRFKGVGFVRFNKEGVVL